jgi:outer membrane murein-binding lipoprotein Lpp
MMSDHIDKINDVASSLDDLAVTVDELKYDSTAPVRPETLDTLKNAIEEAADAADALDDQIRPED